MYRPVVRPVAHADRRRHPRRGRLPVRAGDVDRRIRPLRMVKVVDEFADPVERRPGHVLGLPRVELRERLRRTSCRLGLGERRPTRRTPRPRSCARSTDRARLAHVALGQAQASRGARPSSCTTTVLGGHLERHLRERLLLADGGQHRGGRPAYTSGSAPSATASFVGRRPGGAVHGARAPPRPDLLGDVGQERGERAEHARRAPGAGRRPRSRRAPPCDPYARVLHQLEVVVGEIPRRTARAGPAPSRARSPRSAVGRLVDHPAERREHRQVDRLGDLALGRTSKLSTNFDALRSLIASRRPIFICCSSKAASIPSRALAAQYRTASAECRSKTSAGTTTLPLDFDIFLRSGSSTNPLIAAFVHGKRIVLEVCDRNTV